MDAPMEEEQAGARRERTYIQRQKQGRVRERDREVAQKERERKHRDERNTEGGRRERGEWRKEKRRAKSPVDGDSTKQRCLIGVGPHQVDRGPPNRVLEDDVGP